MGVGAPWGGLFIFDAEKNAEVLAELLKVPQERGVAVGGFGHEAGALENGDVEQRDGFGIEIKRGAAGQFGGGEILFELACDMEEGVLANFAQLGMGEGQLLRERADKATAGQAAGAAGGFLDEVEAAEDAGKRVGQPAERGGGVIGILQVAETLGGGAGDVVLGFKIVKESAFGDAGGVANVVHAGGVEALGAHQLNAGIDQFKFGLGPGGGKWFGDIHTNWLVYKPEMGICQKAFFLSLERARAGV